MSPLNLMVAPSQQQKNPAEKKMVHMNVRMAITFAYMIAIPAIPLCFTGRHLDKTYGTEPFYLIVFIGLGLALSAVLITWKTRYVMRTAYKNLHTPAKAA